METVCASHCASGKKSLTGKQLSYTDRREELFSQRFLPDKSSMISCGWKASYFSISPRLAFPQLFIGFIVTSLMARTCFSWMFLSSLRARRRFLKKKNKTKKRLPEGKGRETKTKKNHFFLLRAFARRFSRLHGWDLTANRENKEEVHRTSNLRLEIETLGVSMFGGLSFPFLISVGVRWAEGKDMSAHRQH